MGCPTTYEGYTVSWTKGKLAKLTKGLKASGIHNYYYNYNAFGQRTSRSYTYTLPILDASAVAMGTLTGYSQVFRYDQSGRLVYESKSCQYYGELGSTDSIIYLYDENGIIGIVYTADGVTDTYYFQRNLLGDVIGIYNTSGTKVGGYAYDAWGNCTITLNTNGIATRNPVRYRGYYYDEDTKLYYLNARYYCPTWRRFISPAHMVRLDPSILNGLNLYSYTNNNPISVAFGGSSAEGILKDGVASFTGSICNVTLNSTVGSKGRLPLPEIPWLVENATTIYGTASSLSAGIPILSHYFKYASIINDEFRLYGISKWKTSLQLSDVSFKMDALGGALIGANVLIDMYDSYQRGVSAEGILLGGTLTAASGVGMFYLNKGIMWAATTIGTAICPGIGTAIGFTVGLVGSILVDIFLGVWIADLIDENIT